MTLAMRLIRRWLLITRRTKIALLLVLAGLALAYIVVDYLMRWIGPPW